MPFARPTLSDLKTQVSQDIATAIPGADALLAFSNLGVLGNVEAGLAYQQYGYLDWIAKQAVPYTATDEFLEAWAGLKGVIRLPATQASGVATFTGTPGIVLPAGTSVVRGDGFAYTTQADGTVGGSGTIAVSILAVADPAGLTGANGDCASGTVVTLASAIAGINAAGSVTTACTGGADIETDDSLRSRMLQVYQNPPQGGCQTDYITWALEVPGVTWAACVPQGFGIGTVVVYVMLDIAEAAYGGFPQGTDGVAALETRGTAATGDQLAVANWIYALQPVTALVTVVAPIANTVNFTIKELTSSTPTIQAAVIAAIKGVLVSERALGGTVYLSHIESAISAVAGLNAFVIQSPSDNIVSGAGSVATLGTVTFI
jgi:uncharacterized phage protein gp47/JayE